MTTNSDQNNLLWAHPLVREWFLTKVGSPTPPQLEGWPSILSKQSTLISAPTGSGKTLTAFLVCLNQLITDAHNDCLDDRTYAIYISPLKALSNDVQKNLERPLEEIYELARKKGIKLKTIRVGLRTGDTPAKDRQSLLKRPPHILVTTPETLYLMLTAEKSRKIIASCETVIIDEIHALVRDKRGVHLALSLERLEALVSKPLLRIGLSATQKPLERIARYLVGTSRAMPNVVDVGHKRQRDLAIVVPSLPLTAVATHEMWDEIYDRLALLAKDNRSTLIFTNTRRLAERIAHHLADRLGEDAVSAHHGSLSREIRLDVETKLKEGKLKALVATASLELGIDIGELDLVCQIGSPRSIAVALQRIGRAGHFYQGISKGRFFATSRDELLECAALLHAVDQGELDALIIPTKSMDVLSQQIVATVASVSFNEDDLFKLVQNASPYADLTKDEFEQILSMLAEGVSGVRGRYGAYLFRDKVNNVVSARRHSRMTALINGGTIVDNGLFTMVLEGENHLVGTLDEDFAVESSRGDIILLGTTSWRVKRIEAVSGKVIVEHAHGAPPSIPFWRGEAPGRTKELSEHVALLRSAINERLPQALTAEDFKTAEHFQNATAWLKDHAHVDHYGASQLLEYVFMGRSALGAVPTHEHIIAERFFDDAGGMQLIIHAPFGARINKAWGLALRKCFCRSFNYELQASATDDGINIALLEQHSFPLEDVFKFLHPNSVRDVLVQAIVQAPLFKTRWRFTAVRSLALPKFRNGKKLPPNIVRILSDDLLASVFPDAAACQDNLGERDIELPDHPLVNEALSDVLTEALDIDGFCEMLTRIHDGSLRYSAVDTPTPSVFAHEILSANPYAYLDDAPLEERRARAVQMRSILPQSLNDLCTLDQDAIALVKAQSFLDVRNKDELHDGIQTLVALPMRLIEEDYPAWLPFLQALQDENRVALATLASGIAMVVSAETKHIFRAIFPDAVFSTELKELGSTPMTADDALVHMIKHYSYATGPITSAELSSLLSVSEREIEKAFIKLEATGLVLRGKFRGITTAEHEWCERRLLARIHRLTLDKLRKEIEPATAEQFGLWLQKWHHVAKDTQLAGEQGLLEVIRQLQGFELPANAWEDDIFRRRIRDYRPEMLDLLGLKGQISWGRLSLHKALTDDTNQTMVIPRCTAPITFFVRDDQNWMRDKTNETTYGLSSIARAIYQFLDKQGASFFADIHKHVGGLAYSVETALWQLTAAGLINADDFDNVRFFLNAKRRSSKRQRVRHSSGRWSVFKHTANVSHDVYVRACADLLLQRYGVVFRELLTREKNLPPWKDLLKIFRVLEERGEIRGGRFVSRIAGEQFALPTAITSLRFFAKETAVSNVSLSPYDPIRLEC